MRAKEYMQQLKKLNQMIENKLYEKEQWQEMATGRSSPGFSERVQSTGSKQRMADAIEKYVDIEAEIDRYIDRLVDAKMDVIQTIEQLDVIEYDILHKVYVQFLSLYEVADMYDKTYSWATTIHGRALKHVQEILDSREQKGKENE